jgi:hypothetical protein
MPHSRYYNLADSVVNHLDNVMSTVTDPFISSRYIGLVAIASVTVYELCIKDIFFRFSNSKHKVFGLFVNRTFDRINGRIKLSVICEEYLPKFGDVYVNRFNIKLNLVEQNSLRTIGKSIKSSYGNIIQWRNQFAHEGNFVSTVTYNEAVESYHLGKGVIKCLSESLRR